MHFHTIDNSDSELYGRLLSGSPLRRRRRARAQGASFPLSHSPLFPFQGMTMTVILLVRGGGATGKGEKIN